METWIALLRGVNVGGHKKLPMADFRVLLGGLGFADVATYIQSGNAVFRAPGPSTEIAENIRAAVADQFGFDTDVMVLSQAALENAVAKNPFPQAEQNPTTLHLFFLGAPVAAPDHAALTAAATQGEEFHLDGDIFYFHTPGGMGKSAMAARLSRLIGVPMTGRNLRSCEKVIELARAL